MNLKTIPTDQLEAELERRKIVKVLPVPLKELYVEYEQKVRNTCIEYVKELYEHKYADEDLVHYIFEYAMQMVYGRDIFSITNEWYR